jgi:threonine dehydratase
LYFKAEHLQRSGAFKFRGACNAVWALDETAAARGVVTHSSGNHGAALALAAKTRGITCHVVVPDNTNPAKTANIERYGAHLHLCAPGIAAREAMCAQLQADTGAVLVHPYADFHVIAGQGTAALELANEAGALDVLIAPISGGGLSGGCAVAIKHSSPNCEMIVAEPDTADDAARSLRSGVRVAPDGVPDTVCDGLRGAIGAPNFDLLRGFNTQAITVSDAETIDAMRLLWRVLKQTVEPSSAICFAAVLKEKQRFAGKRIGVILSGGNVDLDALPWHAA